MTKLSIPIGLEFAELKLEIIGDGGGLRYQSAPLSEFALRIGIDPDLVGDAGWAAEAIAGWYIVYREGGGAPDSAAEAVFCIGHPGEDETDI
jgi:hypothetical protein